MRGVPDMEKLLLLMFSHLLCSVILNKSFSKRSSVLRHYNTVHLNGNTTQQMIMYVFHFN